MYINWMKTHTRRHNCAKGESSGAKNASDLYGLSIDRRGRQQTITNSARRTTGTKERERGGKDRRGWKQIWVTSSTSNGKPCVRPTEESIHIYCCQHFNINIIESTSDVSLLPQLTHRGKKHKLKALFKHGKNTTQRLIYKQTALNKQLITRGILAMLIWNGRQLYLQKASVCNIFLKRANVTRPLLWFMSGCGGAA